MSSLALIEPNTALFLDFDGTLADLAPRPELVRVEPELVGTLRRLHAALDGALAIISGRPIAELDHFLQPLRLPAAGVHGAEYRNGAEAVAAPPFPALAPLLARLGPLAQAYPALRLEPKSAALALHFRAAPQLEPLVREAVAEAVRGLPGLEVLPGKMVLEIKTAGVDKGGAIAAFMRAAPFAMRRPLFAGDDVTDEAGFVAVRRLGGIGVLVGERPSAATVSVPGPAALRCWLHRSAAALAAHGGAPARDLSS